MTLACVITVCLCALVAQQASHDHAEEMQGGLERMDELEDRLEVLERSRDAHFDPAAFEDLRTKVETLRLGQGLKR